MFTYKLGKVLHRKISNDNFNILHIADDSRIGYILEIDVEFSYQSLNCIADWIYVIVETVTINKLAVSNLDDKRTACENKHITIQTFGVLARTSFY